MVNADGSSLDAFPQLLLRIRLSYLVDAHLKGASKNVSYGNEASVLTSG
jgi:hypothetical protein